METNDFFVDLGFYELDGEQVETDIINLTGEDIVLLMKDRKYTYLPRLKKPDVEREHPTVVQDDNFVIYKASSSAGHPIPEEKKGVTILVKDEAALVLTSREDVFIPIMTSLRDVDRGFKIAKGLYRIT